VTIFNPLYNLHTITIQSSPDNVIINRQENFGNALHTIWHSLLPY